jgi:hypothetical protein
MTNDDIRMTKRSWSGCDAILGIRNSHGVETASLVGYWCWRRMIMSKFLTMDLYMA